MWDKILSDPEAFGCAAVFVAEDGDRVVGFDSCAVGRRKSTLFDAGARTQA
jgi:hypothetical protein